MSKTIFTSRRESIQPETRIVNVTPEMAKKWLELNKQNRKLIQARVDQIARDIVADRFYLTHQGIAFDVNGNLQDGQHRLHAIVSAGKGVNIMVTTGLPVDVQAHIDTGRARTAADMMSVLDGVKNSRNLAAIAKMAIAWDNGFRWLSNYKATHEEIRDYAKQPENHRLYRAADVASHGRRYVPVRPTVLGLAYYVSARIDYPDAETFYVEQLTEQIGLDIDSPAKTLHKRLVHDSEKQGMAADFNKLAYVITAWNKFRAGDQITKLQAPKGRGWTVNNYPEPR